MEMRLVCLLTLAGGRRPSPLGGGVGGGIGRAGGPRGFPERWQSPSWSLSPLPFRPTRTREWLPPRAASCRLIAEVVLRPVNCPQMELIQSASPPTRPQLDEDIEEWWEEGCFPLWENHSD